MPFGEAVDYQTITNDSDATTYSGMLSAIGSRQPISANNRTNSHVDPYSTEAMNYAKDIRTTLHQNYDSAANVTGVYLGRNNRWHTWIQESTLKTNSTQFFQSSL